MKLARVLLWLLASEIYAAEPPELTKAKLAHQQAVERAVAPLNNAYFRELQRLFEEFTKAGKLEEAVAVKNEQAKLMREASATITTPEIAKLRTQFVDRTFATTGGTLFTFNSDGTGRKKWQAGDDGFTWEIVDGKMVKIQGADKPHYFWFESRFKGEIADAPDGTRRPITVRQ
jgi:hypothetical protein